MTQRRFSDRSAGNRRNGTSPEFIRQAWPVIEPGTTFIDNWHIDCIGEYLEAVNRGQITRLIVNMPPRHMKSLEITVCYPAWT